MATGRPEEDASTLVSISSIVISTINRDILKQDEGINRKGNMHMESGLGDNRQPLYRQSNRQSTYGAEKSPSRVYPKSDKGKLLIACSSYNIPTVRNMERGGEVIILKKEGKIKTEKVTQAGKLRSDIQE